jgi:peptidoglycan-N-acetylglucosamine deacetylase
METSNDDDGDTATLIKTSLILLSFTFFAFKKPYREIVSQHQQTVVSKKGYSSKASKYKPSASKKKKLYLTFDDGPNRGTKNVFTIVKDNEAPVTFFIVGEHVFASVGQTKMWDSLKMSQQIELCNHSYCHANCKYKKYYEHPDSVVGDFKRTQDSLNLDNSIARAPGRNIWRVDTLRFTDIKASSAAADSLQNAGFVLMGWDVEWEFDHKTMSVISSAEQMVANIDSAFTHHRTMRPGNLVLLAHDQAFVKPDDSLQLCEFFRLLKERDDYELSLVSNYPGAEKDTLLVAR